MTCPDTDVLLDVALENRHDPEIEAHLGSCRECGETVRLVRVMKEGYEPEMIISGAHVEARTDLVMAELATQAEKQSSSRRAAVGTGVLASLTVALTIVATGSLAGGSIWGPAILCLLSGLVAVAYEGVGGRRLGGAS